MFYQVKIPDSQRNFLRYLWWNNIDLNQEFVGYKMGIHMFGGTSSPGCCNHALRRTAIENPTSYDTEVAEALLHNFYADDFLKSVESKEIAIQLIKDVRRICREVRFNLIKLICSPICSECHQRSGLKNADLDVRLPVEMALGTYWDIDEHTFKFKINLT